MNGPRRGRAAPFVALAALAAACAPPAELPRVDLLLRVSAGVEEVAPGQPFPVTVVRLWRKDLEPEPWSDRALAPLAVRLEETTRREDGERIEETRRYRAQVLALRDAVVRPARLRARPADGGPERSVVAGALRIRVRPALDPRDPGAPEHPDEAAPAAARPLPWALVAAALLASLLLVARALRRRPAPPLEPPAPPPPPESPERRALDRLARLAAAEPAGPDALRRQVFDAAETVRTYVSERFRVRVAERTSEEIVAPGGVPALEPAPRDALARVLGGCDAVKFAAHLPSAGERTALLREAEGFVRATSGPSGPAEGAA